MRYVSIFSGIEAASLAWEPLGFEPMAFCEIDEFPSAVLAARWPDVPNLGDITQADWKEFKSKHGAVDIVVGGSPCQSFSIAGGRDSLRGKSRLMFEYIRAVGDLRPEWFVFENVPGCLSTRDDAFGQLLQEMEDIGYQDLAWRVLDSQFWGVAQRRRRVFLVGHLGRGGGFSSAAVLFEPESVRGDTTSSKQKREELAAAARERPETAGFSWHMGGNAGNIGYQDQQSPTLGTAKEPACAYRQDSTVCQGFIGEYGGDTALGLSDNCTPTMTAKHPMDVLCMAHGQANAEIGGGISPTLTLLHEAPIVVQPPATGPTSFPRSARRTAASASSTTSRSKGEDSSSTTFDDVIAMADDNEKTAIDHNLMGTLKVGGGTNDCVASNGEDVTGPLCARDYKGVGNEYVQEGKVICQRATS